METDADADVDVVVADAAHLVLPSTLMHLSNTRPNRSLSLDSLPALRPKRLVSSSANMATLRTFASLPAVLVALCSSPRIPSRSHWSSTAPTTRAASFALSAIVEIDSLASDVEVLAVRPLTLRLARLARIALLVSLASHVHPVNLARPAIPMLPPRRTTLLTSSLVTFPTHCKMLNSRKSTELSAL